MRTVLLASLACLLLSGCQTQLYANLTEKEANAIMAVLLEASIAAEKRAGDEGTYVVFVEEADFARAMRLLEARALPGKEYDDLGKVFGKDAMFSTPMEEKARYLYAMQEELAHTVAAIDGVLEARVHLVLPEQDQLGRQLHTPSGAVFVKHVDDERHDPVGHRLEIRRLVSAAVPNLDEERIVVTFFPVPPPVETAAVAPPWIDVLGVRVSPESLPRLRLAGGVAGAVALVLVVALIVALSRKAKK